MPENRRLQGSLFALVAALGLAAVVRGLLPAASTGSRLEILSVSHDPSRGGTTTVTQQVEVLDSEYRFTAAFALASVLSLLAVASLVAERVAEGRTRLVLAEVPRTDSSERGIP